MGNNTQLVAGNSSTLHPSLQLTGNYSFQQTDSVNAWTDAAISGLGPDVKMAGTGTALNPQTLEVGGVDLGATIAGFTNNFALHSLTLDSATYVELVDQYQNATPSGWTPGTEALYLYSLSTNADPPTLDLDGLHVYIWDGNLNDQPIALTNGTYNGITIVGASVPEPGTLTLLVTGGLMLLGIAYRRGRK